MFPSHRPRRLHRIPQRAPDGRRNELGLRRRHFAARGGSQFAEPQIKIFAADHGIADRLRDGALDLAMTGANSGYNRVTLIYQNDGSGINQDARLGPLLDSAQ